MAKKWAGLGALAAVLGLARAARAFEASRNPDRWPSVSLTQLGSESLNGHQTLVTPGQPNDYRAQRTLNVLSAASFNLPVADFLSVNAGSSIGLSETDTAQTPLHASNTSDNSVLGFSLGLRWFLLEHELTRAGAPRNPDRWPSLGLQASGSTTFNYDAGGINADLLPQTLDSRTLTFMSEDRFPLNDHNTVAATVNATFLRSYTASTPVLNGSLTHQTSLTGTLQWRYYWVGHNLLANDTGANPDRWTMLFLTASGGSLLHSDQTIYPPFAAGQGRSVSNRAISGGVGTRLPMTDHFTMTLEFDEGYTRTSYPPVPSSPGSDQKITTATFQAVFKYYFF